MENFNEMVKQYSPMVYKIIHSLRIYKNQEDYYQIGLIALWEAYEKFEISKASFVTFSYNMIRGRILNALQKEKRIDDKLVLYEPTSYVLIEGSPMCDHYFPYEILKSYGEDLTDRQLCWILHHFIEDLSIEQIAKKYNVSNETVKSWRKGALKKLKRKHKA